MDVMDKNIWFHYVTHLAYGVHFLGLQSTFYLGNEGGIEAFYLKLKSQEECQDAFLLLIFRESNNIYYGLIFCMALVRE